MGRPLYETAINRQDEANVILLLRHRGYDVVPLGLLSPGDFLVAKDNYTALVEFKRRSNTHNHYPTVIIPEQKLRKCLDLSEAMGISFVYMVQFEDGLFAAPVGYYYTAPGGRTDRGDPKDLYTVAHIKKEEFKRIHI